MHYCAKIWRRVFSSGSRGQCPLSLSDLGSRASPSSQHPSLLFPRLQRWAFTSCLVPVRGPLTLLVLSAQAHYYPNSRRHAFSSHLVTGAWARYRSWSLAPRIRPLHDSQAHNCHGFMRRAFTSRPDPYSRARYHLWLPDDAPLRLAPDAWTAFTP
ncbi:unnamed protein product [Linum trigynum]|uniref:Uncharacterized protein n=1 Tax=Linum trigynum TaxID=586398 RepID=A0AAV2E0H0_9ROSI